MFVQHIYLYRSFYEYEPAGGGKWGLVPTDPTPKSCSIQKQNSGMINTPLDRGGADEKVTIHRRADCLCPE
ncbi:hypothetical protein, partial [Edaphovirga cremea]|uniref:hypothetical protein n=1 Tax=Edaphovirga cremea TaxID=2267246 RepID=UPI0039894F6D